jgi:DNA-binding NarL/FixJ family response regulator
MDEARLQVIGEAANGAEIETSMAEVDVLIWSPGSSLSWDAFSTRVENLKLVETTALLLIHDDPKVITRLARLKVPGWGLLSPEASKEELIAAVVAVYEGLVVTNPGWLEHFSTGPSLDATADTDMVETLTGREMEILQLLALGLTNKQIALKLGISAHTVKFHVSSVFGKMGTTNRTETVKLGLQKGLILL